MLRDGVSSNWGLMAHFEDADQRPHDVPLRAEVYGDPIALAALMMSEGLRLADATPRTRAALSTLLMKWSHPDRRTVATTPGWTHDRRAFLLGDGRTIGDQTVVLGHGRRAAAKGPGALGDLSAWTASVASLCAGNPVLLTSVSTAFAAPLLEMLNIESGIIHFRGDSSSGEDDRAARGDVGLGAADAGSFLEGDGERAGRRGLHAQLHPARRRRTAPDLAEGGRPGGADAVQRNRQARAGPARRGPRPASSGRSWS